MLETACKKALEASGITKYAKVIEVSALLTSNDFIKGLNSQYREKDKPTNVLSFPSEELVAGQYKGIDKFILLGDIILALEIIKQEAIEQEKSLRDHLTHLIIHGTLHLIGYDHIEEDEAEVMESMEIKIMESMGLKNPY